MKNTLNGFVEGTTHITTGDKMKDGDHRRDKRNCFYYNCKKCELLSRKCTGSSHCDYYNDGIKVTIIEKKIPNIHTHEKRLANFIKELRNKINYKHLEGKYIRVTILKKHNLSSEDREKAEKQIQYFQRQKSRLEAEIRDNNQQLKKNCLLFGLLIITAPFCYAYYKKNLRDTTSEVLALERRCIDHDLQRRYKNYKEEINLYIKSSESAQPRKSIRTVNEEFFRRALIAYNDEEFERFYELILKSIIDANNINAILHLAYLLHTGTHFKKNHDAYILLLLYASYLGDKESSIFLGNKILQKNKDSTLGRLFLEKAKSENA